MVFLPYLWQMMSVGDVEKILDETQEAVKYQRVNDISQVWLYRRMCFYPKLVNIFYNRIMLPSDKHFKWVFVFCFLQQIDEMLSGALTPEDEDAVLAELEAITQVGVKLHVWRLFTPRMILEHALSSLHIFSDALSSLQLSTASSGGELIHSWVRQGCCTKTHIGVLTSV